MKKLFTLLAFLTCFLGANAIEIVDAEVDFSTMEDGDASTIKFYGWGASDSAKERLSIKDGCLHFESTEATDPSWDCQFHPIGGVSAEIDVTYTLHFKVKGDHAGNVSMLGFGQTPYGQFAITEDWVEGSVDYVCTSASGDILMQCGDWIGTWDIAYLKITHEGKEEKPVTWVEILENGNAETPWADPDVRFDDMDNNYKICAWAKEKGRNLNDDDGWDPFPADIEEDELEPGNHVFVCHGQVADTEGDAAAWDNQFWIESPKQWQSGEEFQLKFRYRANKTVTTQTQVHYQTPSNYLIWHAIGDITFTEEWQEFEQTVTMQDDMSGGWSVCFNLNANDKDAINFYFDDLSWKKMDLEEGYFVAYSNADNGIEYDFDEAIKFEWDATEEAYFATVGKEGDPDSWVKEVMVSTVYGNSKAFKANTLKPTQDINDPEGWAPLDNASNYKIELPAVGVWKIGIDPNENSINFFEIEGEEPWDPIEFVENPTEIVIDAQARTSQDWDAQFWIVGDKAVKAGTKLYVKFDYSIEENVEMGVDEAKVSTQSHAAPGSYLGGAIGDLTFTTQVQTFEGSFEAPKDDTQSIAFNLACVTKEIEDGEGNVTNVGVPLKYKITNVIFGLDNHKESLIDMENTDDDNPNFVLKEGDGWAQHNYGTAPVPPAPKYDLTGDGVVDVYDVLQVIAYMASGDLKGDVDGSGEVDVYDVLAVIANMD
jgi:hypothetical protein